VARRLCEDNQIHVSEIWSYHLVGDEPRFTMVHRSREPHPAVPRVKPAPAAAAPPAKKPAARPVVKAAKPAKATPAKPKKAAAKPVKAATPAKGKKKR